MLRFRWGGGSLSTEMAHKLNYQETANRLRRCQRAEKNIFIEPKSPDGTERDKNVGQPGNTQWAFTRSSRSYGWYKPCLNGLQLVRMLGDHQHRFLKHSQT